MLKCGVGIDVSGERCKFITADCEFVEIEYMQRTCGELSLDFFEFFLCSGCRCATDFKKFDGTGGKSSRPVCRYLLAILISASNIYIVGVQLILEPAMYVPEQLLSVLTL